MDPCIAFVRRNCREVVTTADINLPVSLMNLFSSLLDGFRPNAAGEPPVGPVTPSDKLDLHIVPDIFVMAIAIVDIYQNTLTVTMTASSSLQGATLAQGNASLSLLELMLLTGTYPLDTAAHMSQCNLFRSCSEETTVVLCSLLLCNWSSAKAQLL